MKVQCDVCERAQATVLCCADDAALCGPCDAQVHAANKLAGKHQRVPLLYPSPDDELPLCDVCQVCKSHATFVLPPDLFLSSYPLRD